ncbi:hypothetical protein BV22DRAFT_967713, partial [Leucogyrophana mollusca]
VIASSKNQKGPQGNRLILGPFRFANHDCNPNSQIFPIKGSHAMTLVSVRPISLGEPITVAYTSSGYYRPGHRCLCGTCNPNNPPHSLSGGPSPPVNGQEVQTDGKKKAKRGGRRQRRRKRAKLDEA